MVQASVSLASVTELNIESSAMIYIVCGSKKPKKPKKKKIEKEEFYTRKHKPIHLIQHTHI